MSPARTRQRPGGMESEDEGDVGHGHTASVTRVSGSCGDNRPETRSEAGWRGRVTAGLGVRKVKQRQPEAAEGQEGTRRTRGWAPRCPRAPARSAVGPALAQEGPGQLRLQGPGEITTWKRAGVAVPVWKHGGNQRCAAWYRLEDEPAAEGGLLRPDSHAKSPEKACVALVTASVTMWRFGVMEMAFQRW